MQFGSSKAENGREDISLLSPSLSLTAEAKIYEEIPRREREKCAESKWPRVKFRFGAGPFRPWPIPRRLSLIASPRAVMNGETKRPPQTVCPPKMGKRVLSSSSSHRRFHLPRRSAVQRGVVDAARANDRCRECSCRRDGDRRPNRFRVLDNCARFLR